MASWHHGSMAAWQHAVIGVCILISICSVCTCVCVDAVCLPTVYGHMPYHMPYMIWPLCRLCLYVCVMNQSWSLGQQGTLLYSLSLYTLHTHVHVTGSQMRDSSDLHTCTVPTCIHAHASLRRHALSTLPALRLHRYTEYRRNGLPSLQSRPELMSAVQPSAHNWARRK
jgi:hypothetical protein